IVSGIGISPRHVHATKVERTGQSGSDALDARTISPPIVRERLDPSSCFDRRRKKNPHGARGPHFVAKYVIPYVPDVTDAVSEDRVSLTCQICENIAPAPEPPCSLAC